MAGVAGFEPAHAGVRDRSLTAWLHPNVWQGQSDSNTQPVVLETTALPIELYPRMVMPAGLEPAISSLRGWRPNQLDDGTRWRYGPDSNRRNNSFAGCPLKPFEYRIMAGIVGFEPTVPASKAGALAAWRYPSIVEIRAGLEPVIAAVKGLCPNLLDERTLYAGSCLPALGDCFVCDEYVIYANMQQCCKSKQVIYCR